MKVHVTSCETHAGAWRHQEEILRSIWQLSDKQHSLTESPDEADLIFVGNIRDENNYASLRRHPVINRFPKKCFALSEAWNYTPLLHGIYTNAHKKLPFQSRFRSGAYTLYHPNFKNPHVESHEGRSWEKPKKHLASFAGRDCHPSRKALFALRFTRPDILINDTTTYNAFTHDNVGKDEPQRAFVALLENTKFSICPRGSGAASIRLFESMKMGVAPVIISDDWILPAGPDWSKSALILPESQINQLEKLLVENEHRHVEIAQSAAADYARYFAPPAYFNYLVTQAVDIGKRQTFPETLHWGMRSAVVTLSRLMKKK